MVGLEALTSIATALAVIVAMWAVVSSRRVAAKDRSHQRDLEHHRSLVELLAAFEEMQALRTPHYDKNASRRDDQNDQLSQARARFHALLRTSAEHLEISRGLAFRHIPFGADDQREAKTLAEAPRVGDPESESTEIMVVRGEILAAIDRARHRLHKR